MAGIGDKIGGWAFLVGLVIAIVFALFGPLTNGLLITLMIIGVIVGFLNIADEEVTPFLLSGAVLIIASSFGAEIIGQVGILGLMLSNLLVLFVPATIIVAIKNVFALARN